MSSEVLRSNVFEFVVKKLDGHPHVVFNLIDMSKKYRRPELSVMWTLHMKQWNLATGAYLQEHGDKGSWIPRWDIVRLNNNVIYKASTLLLDLHANYLQGGGAERCTYRFVGEVSSHLWKLVEEAAAAPSSQLEPVELSLADGKIVRLTVDQLATLLHTFPLLLYPFYADFHTHGVVPGITVIQLVYMMRLRIRYEHICKF